jgi:hypothetical protein
MKFYRDLRTQKRLGREEAYYDYRSELRARQHQRHVAGIEKRELNAPVQWPIEKKSRSGIRVMTGAAGVVLGLADFLTSFFDPAPVASPHREEGAPPQGSRDQAIERMSKSLERNEPVQAYDIRSLSHHDHMNLRQRGEPYLRDLVMEYERKSLKYLRDDPGRDR